jgi:hypothetical protein
MKNARLKTGFWWKGGDERNKMKKALHDFMQDFEEG